MQDNTQTQQLDPTIVNMARAIKSVETANAPDPYTAKGKSGEYGAYQYTPETWSGDSKKYLGQDVPLEQATIEQQNKVAYGKIKDLKAQGYNPMQVASVWNSGKPDPTGNVGTNKAGVHFDTPQYAKSVVSAYNQYKAGLTPNLQPTASTIGGATPPQGQTQDKGFLGDLSSDLSNRLGQAGQALTKSASGEINPLSGVLQGLGAVGGGITDVAGDILKRIPVVNSILDTVGKEVGKAAQTDLGQKLIGKYQEFSQQHPELAGDVEAVGNILGGYATLEGAGAVKDAVIKGLAKVTGRDALSPIVSDISPEIKVGTKATSQEVAKRGTVKSLITGSIGLPEDPAIREAAQVVKDEIPKFSGLKTFSEKVNALKDGVSTLGQRLVSNLKSGEIQPILTPEDMTTLENGLKTEISQSPVLVGDAGITAQRIFDQFKRFLPQTGDVDMNAVLDARKKLDSWIQGQKGSGIFDPAKENAISVGLRAVRQGANKLLESKVPEAGVKALLRKQTLLYDAIDNLSPKAAKELGTTRLSRFTARHPVVKGLVKKAATGALIGAGGTAGYGLYRDITGQ